MRITDTFRGVGPVTVCHNFCDLVNLLLDFYNIGYVIKIRLAAVGNPVRFHFSFNLLHRSGGVRRRLHRCLRKKIPLPGELLQIIAVQSGHKKKQPNFSGAFVNSGGGKKGISNNSLTKILHKKQYIKVADL